MSCQINGYREDLWLEHTALWLASILVRESSSLSCAAVRAGTDELGEWGNHKSVPSSFLVPSKPQHRRESGPWSFDILESLHLNLPVKGVLFLLPAPYATLAIIQHHPCVETSSWLTHPNTNSVHSFVKRPRWTKTVTLESNTAWQRKAVIEKKNCWAVRDKLYKLLCLQYHTVCFSTWSYTLYTLQINLHTVSISRVL